MKPRFFASPRELRAWFQEHHGTAAELHVGFYKKATGKPSITWPESVDEALCFGWIDGVRRSLGAEAYTIRFTPRRLTSIWSAINVDRVNKLDAEGKMTEAGRRAFAARTSERTGVYSFERNQAAELEPDQERLLRANARAAEFFDAQPPWYRRTATHWVISAKRAETRARRLDQLIASSAAGRTIAPLTRPEGKTRVPAPKKESVSSRKKSKRRAPARGAPLLTRGRK